jgi:hypothetical protein
MYKLESVLDKFNVISLQDISTVSLQNRFDTKYITTEDKIVTVLNRVCDHFFILTIDGNKIFNYRSTYFDTDDYSMYYAHHRGMLNRQKVRCRRYETTGDVFLEVKRKTNRGNTIKSRLRVDTDSEVLSMGTEFIDKYSVYKPNDLKNVIDTGFKRITLVSKDMLSRITIDKDVQMLNGESGITLPNVVVIEFKRGRGYINKVFSDALRHEKIFPMRFSKYCMGLSLLKDGVKRNNFLPGIRRINKISYVNYV